MLSPLYTHFANWETPCPLLTETALGQWFAIGVSLVKDIVSKHSVGNYPSKDGRAENHSGLIHKPKMGKFACDPKM